MEETPEPKSEPVPVEELEEVKQPSSLLVAQFFLFPLAIIAICVGIFVLFGYLTYEQKNPRDYLANIRTGSEQRRWQAAYELSTLLKADGKELRNENFVRDLLVTYRGAKDQDPRIRRYLALTLGQIGDRVALPSFAVPSLIEGLGDNDTETQIYTIFALGSIKDRSAVPGVLEKLRSEDAGIRKMAAYVLGVLGDPSAIRGLQIALNDVKEDVRWNSAIALAQLHDPSGSTILMNLIDREYVAQYPLSEVQKSEIVMNAVKAIGVLQFQAGRSRIVALSRTDPDLAVRQAAIEALRKF